MQARELEVEALPAKTPDLVFRTSPNWTYVLFFAGLGLLHLTIATLAFLHRRWEAYMSMGLGTIFVIVSIIASRCRFEMAIQTQQRRIRLRTGTRRFNYERYIPFAAVHGVRLTLSQAPDDPDSRIEIMCENEDIECPPTSIPRQEALCLAVLMGVRLIKVSDADESEVEHSERLST